MPFSCKGCFAGVPYGLKVAALENGCVFRGAAVDFKSVDFWVAVGVALLVKIKTNQQLGPWQVVTTMMIAVGAAWVGSEYAAEVFSAPEPVAAAIVTLTAEGVMRWVLIALNDPKAMIDIWKHWKGGGK